MHHKKGFIGLLFNPVVILIIGIIIALLFVPKLNVFKLAIFSDESQLKSEYNTRWADVSDGGTSSGNCEVVPSPEGTGVEIYNEKLSQIKNSGKGCVCWKGICHYEDDNFQIDSSSGGYWTFASGNLDVVGSASLRFRQKYKGQEIAFIVDGANFNLDPVINGLEWSSSGGHVIILKPHTLEPTKWDVIHDGRKIKEISANDNGFLTLTLNPKTSGVLRYWGDKSQFSCDLSENERWIQTQWVGSVSIEDVIKKDGLLPTKFCKETRPFILRDIQQGETAIFPDPIPDFNRGKTITSPSANQFIVVNYAVYQAAGLENPTTGTQAYKCIQRDSNYKCLGWAIEEVIKPVEVVVQCKVNSDCPLPLTQFQSSECLGYFKGCQNNKCVYDNTILNAPICRNQIVTIVKQIQEVEQRTVVPTTGNNIFTFSQNFERTSFNIGDKTFTATPSQYLCQVPTDADFLNAPSPSSDCWKTQFTYGDRGGGDIFDTKKMIIDGLVNPATNELTSLITIQYFAGGKLTRGEYAKPEHWYNTFIFTVDTGNAMQLDAEDSSFVIKDSIKKIKLQLTNNLPNSEVIIKSQQKVKTTNQNLPEQSKTINAIKGINNIEIDMNTQNIGLNSITIQGFYKIKANSEVLIPSDKIILNYDIVTELPSVEKVVEIEKVITKPNFIKEFINKIIAWIKNLFT